MAINSYGYSNGRPVGNSVQSNNECDVSLEADDQHTAFSIIAMRCDGSTAKYFWQFFDSVIVLVFHKL